MEFKEQLISFKTAKLAKEKGFDYCVNNYYWIDENSLDCGDGDCEFACLNHNKYDDLYSAPNQTELQKWLRDVYSFIVYVVPNKNGYDCFIGLREQGFIREYINCCKIQEHDYDYFKTYEEALETGLYEALKLI